MSKLLTSSELLALRAELQRKNLTQEQHSIACGVSQSQLSRILAGKTLRRSKAVEKVFLYAFSYDSAYTKKASILPPKMTTALSALWDGSTEQAEVLTDLLTGLRRLRQKAGGTL